MPVPSIQFTSPDDVYKFLAKLRAHKFINFEDDSNKIEGDVAELSKMFIVATDKKTYYLPELLALSDDEMLLSGLKFAKKGSPKTTLSLFSDRRRLESENGDLIHNPALAAAILNLTPRRDKILNLKSVQCKDPQPENVLPYIDTKTEKTFECAELIEEIFSLENRGVVRQVKNGSFREFVIAKNNYLSTLQKYTKLTSDYFVNTALLDLLTVGRTQMQEYLLQLSKTNPATCQEINEVLERKNKELLDKINSLTKLLNEFSVKYASEIAANLPSNENAISALRTQNTNLHDGTQPSLDKITKSRKTSGRVMTAGAILCAIYGTGIPIGVPMLVVGGILRHLSTKKLRVIEGAVNAELVAADKNFLQIEAPRMHAQIIQPSLAKLEAIPGTLVNAEPASENASSLQNSNVVDFSAQRSALQQSSLLASSRTATATDSSMELAPILSPRRT